MTQEEDNSDLFDGFGNGSLHMYVVCTPGWTPYKEGDARYLDLDFHWSDWEAIFFGILNIARPWGEYQDGEDIDEFKERNRRRFEESVPEFPMLRRIFDNYEDYIFDVGEATKLRDECVSLKSRTENPESVKALRKLIYGCDQALAANCSLMFVCD